MAKTAFATWRNRIAPVFDVSQWVQLVETDGNRIVNQVKVRLANELPNLRASRLTEMGVATLVCGAISKPLQTVISDYGIEVIPFMAGNLQAVVQAWLNGRVTSTTAYRMPGCRKTGGLGFKRGYGSGRRERKMDDIQRSNRGGSGRGCRRQKGGGKGKGRGLAANQSACVCPRCGFQAAHESGVPCMNQTCAQCGAVMTRK